MEPYDVLGVPQDASLEDIRRAYRKLALQHHPDKNEGSQEAADAFKRISEAYAAIGEADAREQYHRSQQQQAGNMDVQSQFAEVLETWFAATGGMFGMGGGHHHGHHSTAPDDLIVTVEVGLGDVVYGTTKRVEQAVLQACNACDARGAVHAKDIVKCSACHGRGIMVQQLAPGMFVQSACHSCQGRCTTIRNGAECKACSGAGAHQAPLILNVQCPVGVPNGFQYIVQGGGGLCARTRQPRNAMLHFKHVLPEGVLRVDAATGDVHARVPVPLEALLCGSVDATLPLYGDADDRVLRVSSNRYVDPTRTFSFAGHGLPTSSTARGTLHVTLDVRYPPDNHRKMDKYRDIFCRVFKHETQTQTQTQEQEPHRHADAMAHLRLVLQ